MLVAGTALAMSSCNSAKEEAPLSTLNGEWNIVEIKGTPVKVTTDQEAPFIGFDTKSGRMFGYSGCNRMMASFDINTQPGKLELGAVGSTRMACPDLTLEQNILAALGEVKEFKKDKDERIALCDASDKTVLVLEKVPPFAVDALQGKWAITQVSGEAVPSGMENQPFIEFDIKAGRIHGNAGCNVMNGEFKTDANDPAVITFPGVITTMMACPDMEIEGKILNAVNNVQSFAKVAGGVGFYNGEGQLVLVIEKL